MRLSQETEMVVRLYMSEENKLPSVEIRIRIGNYEMLRVTGQEAHFVAKFGRANEGGWYDLLHSDIARVIAPIESVHVEIRPIYEEMPDKD